MLASTIYAVVVACATFVLEIDTHCTQHTYDVVQLDFDLFLLPFFLFLLNGIHLSEMKFPRTIYHHSISISIDDLCFFFLARTNVKFIDVAARSVATPLHASVARIASNTRRSRRPTVYHPRLLFAHETFCDRRHFWAFPTHQAEIRKNQILNCKRVKMKFELSFFLGHIITHLGDPTNGRWSRSNTRQTTGSVRCQSPSIVWSWALFCCWCCCTCFNLIPPLCSVSTGSYALTVDSGAVAYRLLYVCVYVHAVGNIFHIVSLSHSRDRPKLLPEANLHVVVT